MKRMRTVLAVFLTLTLLLSMFCQPLEAAGVSLAVAGKTGTGTSIVMPTAGLLQGLTGLLGKIGGGSGIATIAAPPAENAELDILGALSVDLYVNRKNQNDPIKYSDGMELQEGDTLSLDLNWNNIPDGVKLEGKTVVYDFGANVNLLNDYATEGTVTMPGCGAAGSYVIKDGKLYITFNSNADDKNSRELSVEVNCNFGPPDKEWIDDDDITFEFGNQKFNFKYSDERSWVNTSKETTGYSWDPVTKKFTAHNKITVTVSGQAHDITVTDTTGGDVSIVGDVKVTYNHPSNEHYNPSVGSSVTMNGKDGFNMTLSGNFYDGDTITFEYDTELKANGSLDNIVEDMLYNSDKLTNHVKATFMKKDQTEGEPNVSESETKLNVTKPYISKAGVLKEVEGGDSYIEWTIKIPVGELVSKMLDGLKGKTANDLANLATALGVSGETAVVQKLFDLYGIKNIKDTLLTTEYHEFMAGYDETLEAKDFKLVIDEWYPGNSCLEATVKTKITDTKILESTDKTNVQNKVEAEIGKEHQESTGSVPVGKDEEPDNWSAEKKKGEPVIVKDQGGKVTDLYFTWHVTVTLPKNRNQTIEINEGTSNDYGVANNKDYDHLIRSITVKDDKDTTYQEGNQYRFNLNQMATWSHGANYSIFLDLTKVPQDVKTVTIDVISDIRDRDTGEVDVNALRRGKYLIKNTAGTSTAQFEGDSGGGVQKKGSEISEDGIITWTVQGLEDFVKRLYDEDISYSVRIEDSLDKYLTFIPDSVDVYTIPEGKLNGIDASGFYAKLKEAITVDTSKKTPDGGMLLEITWNPSPELLNSLRNDKLVNSYGNPQTVKEAFGSWSGDDINKLTFTFQTRVDPAYLDYEGKVDNTVDYYIGGTLEGSATTAVKATPDERAVLEKEGHFNALTDESAFKKLLETLTKPNTDNKETAQTDFSEETALFNDNSYNANGEANFFFTVDVNPNKRNFRNYMQGKLDPAIIQSSKIALVDTLGTSLSLLRNTLKVYSYTLGRYLTPSEYSVSLSTEAETGKQVATIIIPDEQHLRISYWAWLTTDESYTGAQEGPGATGGNGGYITDGSNVIQLLGAANTYSSGNIKGWKSFTSNANMNGVGNNFGIEKVNEDGEPLSGATFKVTAVEFKNGEFVPETMSSTPGPIQTGKDAYGVSVEQKITKLGITSITGLDADSKCHIYKLEEIEAPDGYELAAPIYFVFENSLRTADGALKKIVTDNGVRVVKDSGKITVEDKKVIDLTITKKVNGASGDTTKFKFTVELSGKATGTYNYTISGNNTESGVITGTKNFELADGDSLKITGLPKGTTYTITEDPGDDYTSDKADDTVSDTLNDNGSVTFTNTREKGSLSVTKTVVGTTTEDSFTFKVKLTPPEGYTLSSSYEDGGKTATLSGDLYTVTLKNGETFTFKDLPVGTDYTVYEEDGGKELKEGNITSKNYKVEYSGETGKVSKDGSTVTVKNTKNVTELTLKKVLSDTVEPDKTFTFTVTLKAPTGYNLNEVTFTEGKAVKNSDGTYTVTLGAGETCTFENLPKDTTYTISETSDTANYEVKVEDSNNAAVISAKSVNGTANGNTVTFTNTRKTGGLKITKHVSGTANEPGKVFHFTVELKDGKGDTVYGTFGGKVFTDGKYAFTLEAGADVTITGIPVGVNYTVYETDEKGTKIVADGVVDGYKVSYTNQTGEIKEGTAEVTVTNTKNVTKLMLKKNVVGDTDESKTFTFNVTLTKDGKNLENVKYNKSGETVEFTLTDGKVTLKDGQTATFDNLSEGTEYSISEVSDANYSVSVEDTNGNVLNNVASGTADNNTVTFTNTQLTSLVLKKTVSGEDTSEEFRFNVTLKNGEETLTGVKYTKTGVSGELTLTDGKVTLKAGQTATFKNLPYGTSYEITEVANAKYTTSIKDSTGTKATGKASGNTVEFINTRKTGGFSVTKEVTGDGADTNKQFTFKVTLDNYTGKKYLDDGDEKTYNGPFTFTLKNGETKTFSGIPTGVGYTVVEDDYTAQNYNTTTGSITGSVNDKIAAHTVTNNYTKPGTGSISVTKKVDGGVDPVKDREFTFTITLTPENPADISKLLDIVISANASKKVENGKVVVTETVKDGGTVTISDIPYGTEYDISETQLDDFEAPKFSSGKSGKITKEANTVTLTCTNTLKTGSLEVTKKVVDGDNAKEFNFTVTLDNYNDKSYTLNEEVKTYSGPIEFTLKHGETATITDLEVGTHYTVTEAADDDYTTKYSGKVGDIKPAKPAQVTVTNIKKEEKVGSLTVEKIVKINGVEQSTSEPFTIMVTTKPVVKDGKYGEMTFTNGVASFDLESGESITAENLPEGIEYTVEETNSKGYSVSYTGNTGTITDGTTAEATVTNSKKVVGGLKVEKIVKINDKVQSAGEEFTIKVTLSDKTVNGTFGEMTFTNGVASFELKSGESITAENLPNGIEYTVEETDAKGYDVSYTGKTGTITDGTTAEATVTNSKKVVGGLKVEKIVKINDKVQPADEEFTIKVTLSDKTVNGTFGGMTFTNGVASFELKGGESITAENLPNGIEYTVEETDAKGYDVSYTGNTGTITDGTTAEATVTNSKEVVGNLTVQKTVAGNNADETKSFEIVIRLSEPIDGTFGDMNFVKGVATVHLTTRQAATATGLPANLGFIVTENDYSAEGYVATYTYNGGTTSAPVQGTITEGDTASVYITNTKDTFGSLTLTKHVAGENPDLTKAFTFSVKLTGPTGENIIPAGRIADAQGYFTVELTADQSVTFENLPVGTVYTISEADYSSEGYTGTVTEGTSDGVIVEGANQVAYTNTKAATTSLMIRKELSGTAITQADAETLFTFHVALTAPAGGEQLKPSYEYGGKIATVDATGVYVVTLKGGEGFVFMNLPDGTTYSVTEVEANLNGFTTVIPDNASGALDTNSCPIVTFINSKELRETSLTVRKTVQGDDADYSKAFNFTVTLEGYTGPYTLNGVEAVTENGIITFTLMSGQSATIAGIPENTVYSVTELEANADGYVTNVNGSQNGVLTPDTESSVEFVNAKWKEAPKTGSLTVRKTVTGTAAEYGRRFSFTVMLSDTSVTGIYGQMNFVGGVASFALAHGESITATDLPAGITYTIFENDAGDYIQNSMGATGMITENGFAEAMFINTKDKEEKYGDLSVTKTVTGEGYDPAQQFNFTVTLSDSSVNGQYGDMNFVGGVANFTLTAGQTAYAAQLPADIFYTVTEEPTENYISTATGDSGAIVGDSMVYAEFVNEYVAPRVGGFNITKLVTGTAGDLNRFFTFRVVLSDASINGVYGDIAFADGFATVFLRSGMTVYCDGLPEGTGYSVIELDSDDYMVTYTNAAGTVEVGTSIPVTIINHKDIPEIPEEHEEEQLNPHDDDMNAGVGGDRPHGDDMNAGVGGDRPHGDDMNPATGDFELEHYSNAFITITVLWAMVFIFGAVVLADKRRRDK